MKHPDYVHFKGWTWSKYADGLDEKLSSHEDVQRFIQLVNPTAYKRIPFGKLHKFAKGLESFVWATKNYVYKITQSEEDAQACEFLSRRKKIPGIVKVHKVFRIRGCKQLPLWCIKMERLVCDLNETEMDELDNSYFHGYDPPEDERDSTSLLAQASEIQDILEELGVYDCSLDCLSPHNMMKDKLGRLTVHDFGFTTMNKRVRITSI